MSEVETTAREYVLRLDVAMNDVLAGDVLQGRQLYDGAQ